MRWLIAVALAAGTMVRLNPMFSRYCALSKGNGEARRRVTPAKA